MLGWQIQAAHKIGRHQFIVSELRLCLGIVRSHRQAAAVGGGKSRVRATALAASSVEARLQTHAADVVYYLPRSLDTHFLCERIDAALESKHIETDFDSVVIGSTTILATAFTAGYTFWVLRGGYLLASLVSSMPAWRMLDPLPILDNFCHEDLDDEQEESLQSMVIK